MSFAKNNIITPDFSKSDSEELLYQCKELEYDLYRLDKAVFEVRQSVATVRCRLREMGLLVGDI